MFSTSDYNGSSGPTAESWRGEPPGGVTSHSSFNAFGEFYGGQGTSGARERRGQTSSSDDKLAKKGHDAQRFNGYSFSAPTNETLSDDIDETSPLPRDT